jgi:2-amino-4-hydroxy-6-hydroxymethyldihydropteridine diphosphokinase
LGNKFENLQTAVDFIFEEIGGVEKISSVYQTPALGFEGDDFLNCVIWIRSWFSPQEVLEKVLNIEKNMGRIRDKAQRFTSRVIDIDLLFVDDLEIETKELTVPHPEISNRKFVLQPMAEVNASFIHPKIEKNIMWLLANTRDDSRLVKMSKWLRNPIKEFDFSNYNYIAVEGNIGAGKTSLVELMAVDFNGKLLLERFQENPFLPKFYQEPGRYAFPLEMSFLADRYQQLVDNITQFDLFKELVIADYDLYKSMIFARITLSEEEFELYKKLFHLMHKELPKPDLYVYLHQTPQQLLENIQQRGRDYEQSIEEAYLTKINEGYLAYIKNQHLGTIKIIDMTDKDFVNNRKDYLTVLKEILN